MTDSEQDEFFIKILKDILTELKESSEHCKKYTDEENKEIYEENLENIEVLEDIIKNISGIDDLAEMDEDTITAVYEFLAEYAGNFVIAPESNKTQHRKDKEDYSKLEEILYLFLDTEDEE